MSKIREKILSKSRVIMASWQDTLIKDLPKKPDVNFTGKDLEAWNLRDLQTALVIYRHLQHLDSTMEDLRRFLDWQHKVNQRLGSQGSYVSMPDSGLARADIRNRKAASRRTAKQRMKSARRRGERNDNPQGCL
jgi:hypothetical protein